MNQKECSVALQEWFEREGKWDVESVRLTKSVRVRLYEGRGCLSTVTCTHGSMAELDTSVVTDASGIFSHAFHIPMRTCVHGSSSPENFT